MHTARAFRMRAVGIVTTGFILAPAACLEAGTRASGYGEVTLVGTSERRLVGPCTLGAEPGWGVPLPWVVRWCDSETDWNLELRTASRPEEGTLTLTLPADGRDAARATLFEGHTVRGAASGTVEVRRDDDRTTFHLDGSIDHRERWSVEARCEVVETDR